MQPGCDSTITINLTINHSTESDISETSCGSYTAPDGQIYNSSGIKTAVIPNATGCDSTITINLTVNHSTESSITETSCDSFEWNGTTYTTSGDYSFTTINSAGCDSTAYLHLTIDPTPATPAITQDGTVLHSDAGDGNQWYDLNGLIHEAIYQDYEVTDYNGYYVIVTLSNCSSQPSNTIHVVATGIELSDIKRIIKVYPNPVSDEFTIEMEGQNDRYAFEVVNASGMVVYDGSFTQKTKVQTSNFAPGIYLIKIGTGNAYEFIKIIVE